MKSVFLIALFSVLLVFTVQFKPATAHASSLFLIDCTHGSLYPGTTEHECGFLDVIAEIKQLINAFFILSVPLTIIAIAYAGIQILFAQGNMSKITDARKLIQKILTGFIVIMVAWLLVYTITSSLLKPQFYNLFLSGNAPTTSN